MLHEVPFATGVLHCPDWQVSTVHGLPSIVHPVPLAFAGCWHTPLVQKSSVQTLVSAQLSGVWVQPAPGVGLQPSTVQASLSSQFLGGKEHPVAGWHWSSVQALPSLQAMLS